jgi:hypothetical protein
MIFDVHTHVPKIFVSVRVDFFSFQGFHEALATRIVVRIRRPTHARDYLVRLSTEEKTRRTSGGCGGEKVGGTAASVVGEWRGVRTTAQ